MHQAVSYKGLKTIMDNCKKWSWPLMRGGRLREFWSIKTAMIMYFSHTCKYTALIGKIVAFWIGGRLWEDQPHINLSPTTPAPVSKGYSFRRGTNSDKTVISLIRKTKTTILHAHHNFQFCTFLCRHCMTTTWKCLILRFTENVNKPRWSFLSLFKFGSRP